MTGVGGLAQVGISKEVNPPCGETRCAAPPALEVIFPLTDALHAAKGMGTAYKKVGNAKKLSYTPVLQSGSKEGNEKRIVLDSNPHSIVRGV